MGSLMSPRESFVLKKVAFGLTALVLFVAGLSILNCNGTQYRTDDLDVSNAQVVANLNSLSSLSTLSTGTSFSTMLQSFLNIQQSPNGSSLYYGQAPSSMASVFTIAN